MEYLEINGGKPLRGEVEISGAKNATFPILSAVLLIKGKMRIKNIPRILDVQSFMEILTEIGVVINDKGGEIFIDTSKEINSKIALNEKRNLRGSQTLLGALIARNGEAVIPPFGGCNINIGPRPIDLHFKALSALGANLSWDGKFLVGKVKGKLKGAAIFLDKPSVGATENAILGAVLAEGETTIENAAREPEIRDLINFLNLAGAKIEVNGSGGVIKIKGVKDLKPVDYSIMPDRIEAATYLLMGAITRGRVTIKKSQPQDYEPVILKLVEIGFEIKHKDGNIEISGKGPGTGVTVNTQPFPGFPTDAQSQMMALLSIAKGTSVITETIFENRFKVAEELIKMGASIRVERETAIINGVDHLTPSEVEAPDLRGGAALLLAALSANGISVIFKSEHIDRGYESYIEKIRKLGGVIVRKTSP